MNENPDEINNPDRQIAARVYNEAEAYAETRRVSRGLNEKRTTSRKKIEEMGFRKDSYQAAIRVVKDLSPREQKDFMRDLQTFLKILGGRQADLFPDEALKAAKREEKLKAAAAENKVKTKAEKDAKSDANPKSNPARGGAGKAKPALTVVPPSGDSTGGDQLIKDVAARKEAERLEQEAGANALDAGLPETKKSQSQQSAERLAGAGIK